MNNRYIVGIIGLIILGAALWWLMAARTASVTMPEEIGTTGAMMPVSTTQSTEGEMIAHDMATMPTVIYTNEGFSPAELTVKAGTMVNFINQSDSPMWVASAMHPTHLLYPEFDEKASVAKGESYSFTFEKVGAHKYHNHMNAAHRGTITVE